MGTRVKQHVAASVPLFCVRKGNYYNEDIKEKMNMVEALLKRVNCLYLPTADPHNISEWFKRFFGLDRNGWIKLGDGLSLIILPTRDEVRTKFTVDEWAGIPNYEMYMLQFEVSNDIIELHRSLKESGAVVEELRDQGGCGMEFGFYDPDGNKFCAYELQTMVWLNVEGPRAEDPNPLKRFGFGNCYFHDLDLDAFLTRVTDDVPGATRRLQIVEPSAIRAKNPDGLKALLEALEQFNEQHPDKAFRIIFQEG